MNASCEVFDFWYVDVWITCRSLFYHWSTCWYDLLFFAIIKSFWHAYERKSKSYFRHIKLILKKNNKTPSDKDTLRYIYICTPDPEDKKSKASGIQSYCNVSSFESPTIRPYVTDTKYHGRRSKWQKAESEVDNTLQIADAYRVNSSRTRFIVSLILWSDSLIRSKSYHKILSDKSFALFSATNAKFSILVLMHLSMIVIRKKSRTSLNSCFYLSTQMSHQVQVRNPHLRNEDGHSCDVRYDRWSWNTENSVKTKWREHMRNSVIHVIERAFLQTVLEMSVSCFALKFPDTFSWYFTKNITYSCDWQKFLFKTRISSIFFRLS